MPRASFFLKITGEPGATVGLVIVDKDVYALNDRHLLTQEKVIFLPTAILKICNSRKLKALSYLYFFPIQVVTGFISL